MWNSMGRERSMIFLSLIMMVAILIIRVASGGMAPVGTMLLEIFSWVLVARGMVGMFRMEIIKDRSFRVIDKITYLILAMLIINGGFDKINLILHPWIIVGTILIILIFMWAVRGTRVFFWINLTCSKIYFKYVLKGDLKKELRYIMESSTGRKFVLLGIPSYYVLSQIHQFAKEEKEKFYLLVSKKDKTFVYEEYINFNPEGKEYLKLMVMEDKHNFPLEERTADVVITLFSWDFFKIKEDIKEIKRILRVGGRFMIIENGMLFYLNSLATELGSEEFRNVEINQREYYALLTGRK